MRHEIIIKREDGSQVQISLHAYFSLDGIKMSHRVAIKGKGKRKFTPVIDTNSPSHRRLSKEERHSKTVEAIAAVVTQEEITKAQAEFYAALKPLFMATSSPAVQ